MWPSDHGRCGRGEWRDHAEHVGRRVDKLAAEFDANRAARLTGHKSLFRRLLDRLRSLRRSGARTVVMTLGGPLGCDLAAAIDGLPGDSGGTSGWIRHARPARKKT